MTRYATAVGAYEITSVPGQGQLAHCHGLFIKPEKRGQGFAHKLKRDQMGMLQYLGYDYAQCTVDASNAAQIKVLEQAGWELLTEFHNSRTGGRTQIWGKEI